MQDKGPDTIVARALSRALESDCLGFNPQVLVMPLWYKKKYIWSLSPVPGTKLLKLLEVLEWQEYFLSFTWSPFSAYVNDVT